MPGNRSGTLTAAAGATAAPGPIEMVALDVDGTLLRSDKQLTANTAATIAAVRRMGVKVVLASARPPRSLRPIYDELNLDTPMVNYNGALIHEPATARTLYHQPLEPALARYAVELARAMDPEVMVSLEIMDRWHTDRVNPSLETETSKVSKPDVIAPIERLFDQPITKLMLLAEPRRLAPVHQAIRQVFGKRVGLMVSDAHLLQVVHPQVDKGNAVARVAARYGIAAARVMAIGDAPNDVGMLRWAGLGAAMGNAWPEAIEAADIRGPGNDQEGVAMLLKRWVLGGGATGTFEPTPGAAQEKAARNRIPAAG